MTEPFGATHLIPESHQEALRFIEEVTAEADAVQRRVLSEILSQNGNTEYLRRHGLAGCTDEETFKRLLPIITYEDIKADVDRIAHGDTSPILSSKPHTQFFISSGTSNGQNKLIPKIESDNEQGQLAAGLLKSVMIRYMPDIHKGKTFNLLFSRRGEKTPGGIIVGAASSSYINSNMFKHLIHDPFFGSTSPIEVVQCLDFHQSMYAQLLCGLVQRDEVLRVKAMFACGLVQAINFLEKHWQQICQDIRVGQLSDAITDDSVRRGVSRVMTRPDPELAELIKSECQKESWQGIVTRLWPKAKYIDTIITGTMIQYVPMLEYYSGGLPLASMFYISSESIFGINLTPICKPEDISYTLIPTLCYFEFLPVKLNSHAESNKNINDHPINLVDVQLGHNYEIVITTYAGLYRYRVGDVLQCTGFKNKAPQFKFVSRQNAYLSIQSESVGEVELSNAINNSLKHLEPFGVTLVDYTSHADMTTVPGHYVLYWELKTGHKPVPQSVFEQCCLIVEESLNNIYRCERAVQAIIGPLEIRVLEEGAFDELMNYMTGKGGASVGQYKTPRCVKLESVAKLLNAKAKSKYFSPSCPKWELDL